MTAAGSVCRELQSRESSLSRGTWQGGGCHYPGNSFVCLQIPTRQVMAEPFPWARPTYRGHLLSCMDWCLVGCWISRNTSLVTEFTAALLCNQELLAADTSPALAAISTPAWPPSCCSTLGKQPHFPNAWKQCWTGLERAQLLHREL